MPQPSIFWEVFDNVGEELGREGVTRRREPVLAEVDISLQARRS